MKVFYSDRALAQLDALPTSIRNRIVKKIKFYSAQPDPLSFARHLVAYSAYRFRIGEYRVVCDFERDTLFVILIGKRDGVYKNL